MNIFTIETLEQDLTLNTTSIQVELVKDDESEPYYLDVTGANIVDASGHDEQTDVMLWAREKCDISIHELMSILAESGLEMDFVKDSTGDEPQYYYSVDETKLDEAIIKYASTQDIDIEELYDEVKTPDLIVDVEETMVREKVQQGIPVYLEDGYYKGDASEEQLVEYCKNNNLEISEDIEETIETATNHMDKVHAELIEPTIIERSGSKSQAIIDLIKHGIHEQKI